MQDTIMRRWPKGNVGGVMGAMDRSGLIATLHDWDITNTGDVLDIIRGRLRNEVIFDNYGHKSYS